ncbi:ribosomal RNA small subunit methyltransferase A [Candidatus Babeliales bacterium]|nr:ribosomal RNA small subunit methyltransferase A [Candidatus Babeliales bacterium]
MKNNTEPRKKKALGQHFLRKQSVVDHMIDNVVIDSKTPVLEIGCGDGFLTRSILDQTKCKKLLCYEIDPEWAEFVNEKIKDPRLEIRVENFLETELSVLENDKPWVLLANLPYQVTFPILFKLLENKHLFSEGIVMIQEEVAQKIVAQKGKGYNATSLFLQYHFELKLMEKIEPQAFTPPPKVHSRLIYFKPKLKLEKIPNEQEFWKFLKLVFKQPRRTLKNNLKQTHHNFSHFSEILISKRAQQLTFEDFLTVWSQINS